MKKWSIFKPELIIYNAYLHTVDKNDSISEAVAISKNKIIAVGSNKEIMEMTTEDTLLIDAKMKSVIPGIIDSHNHTWEAGQLMKGIVTLGIPSIKKLKEIISERVKDMKDGEWLHGGCWIETQFEENRMPTKYDLDEVAPNNPVVLDRIFSTVVANSNALKIAGITKDTKDPVGGEIGRDRNGEPNGLLFRTAKSLVKKCSSTSFSVDQFCLDQKQIKKIEDAITLASKDYIKYGITSIVEPGVTPAIVRAYQNLRKKGELIIRHNLMPNWHGFVANEVEDFYDNMVGQYGLYTGFGDEWLSIGALKMAVDGGLTSKTALKSWPYKGEELQSEIPLRCNVDNLKEWVRKAHNAGWSVGIHVMGDIAIQKAVDAMYDAYKENPVIRRHSIIHAYYPTDESLEKMAEAGIIAALQPAFIYNEADGYDELLPEDKIETYMPMRKYIEAGVTIASGTDMPSAHHNPFWNIYSAISRKGMQGFQLGTTESITIDEMLRTMTINSAYLIEEDSIKGSIEPGKLADIVILDRCLANIEEEEIKDIEVEFTILDGEIVYIKSKGMIMNA